MRFKIGLLVLCVIALVGIMLQNISVKREKDTPLQETSGDKIQEVSNIAVFENNEKQISRAEVFRLVSYLYYTKEQIEKTTSHHVFDDCKREDWYYPYVCAIYEAGFTDQTDGVGDSIYVRPVESCTMHEANLLFDKILKKMDVSMEEFIKVAAIDLGAKDPNEYITRSEFLDLYEAVLDLRIQEDEVEIETKDLLLLKLDGEHIITQDGEYELDGCSVFMDSEESGKENATTEEIIHPYIDTVVSAVITENEMLYFRESGQKEIKIKNVFIKQGVQNQLEIFLEGVDKTYPLERPITTKMEQRIGNITYHDGVVSAISIKPDLVSDRVLVAGKDYIELEKYGRVPLDLSFKIYKIYDGLQMETANAILVGYENTQFILENNKICAAIITEKIKAENIRVLLRTTDYKSMYHNQVEVTCEGAFTIKYGTQEKKYKKGKTATLKKDSKLLKDGKVQIIAQNEKDKITILSIKRMEKNPSYRGSLEVRAFEEGLVVINELPLEEYLYAVVPSEMPTTYGKEALKVQAVCARSYAYNQLLENRYSEYGANVDDSTSCQVYNNVSENKTSIAAVKETYGQVIMHNGEVITAYYFSTSCGMTTSLKDVWNTEDNSEYLVGKLQVLETEALKNDSKQSEFSKEEAFKNFLKDTKRKTLDSDYPWYRWKLNITYSQITENVNTYLKSRYEANPSLIKVRKEDGNEVSYCSEPIDTIGEVINVVVIDRKESGIVTSLLIEGTKNSILVRSEYNIRFFLSPKNTVITRNDKSKVDNLDKLPSAFFIIEPMKKEKEGIRILGGGFGHGVGMSQNGVKTLTQKKQSYEDIVHYYYNDVDIVSIYK